MNNDDAQIGKLLTRREVLALLGGTGALVIAGCAGKSSPSSTSPSAATGGGSTAARTAASAPASAATQASAAGGATGGAPSCIVRPAETEGPYFVDEKINRSDIRSDPSDGSVKDGAPLALTMNVSRVGSGGACTPFEGATVDVWHCDAAGVYSDASDPSFNTKGEKFLRGYQTTDANGRVQFATIYPGWYQGRAVHIHFKIRSQSASGGTSDFTSQLYFDDSLTDQVHAQAPYAQKGAGRTRNNDDGIFRGGGDQLTLDVVKSGSGYAATFDIGLQA